MERGAEFRKQIAMRTAALGIKGGDRGLARLAGISEGTLRNLWLGRSPEFGTLVSLADALGTTPAQMFDLWAGRPPAAPGATESPETVASAIGALAVELHVWRTEDRERIGDLEATVNELLAGSLGAPSTEGGVVRLPRRVIPE